MSQTPETLYFLIPGDIDTLTGGYRYDKRIVQGLRALGRTVELISLAGNYPWPDASELSAAQACLAELPDGALALIDGLASGVMQKPLASQAGRLRLVSLVHHPLALETGLSAQQAEELRASERAALQYMERIITTSDTTALSLRDYGVAAEQISTICPGTDRAPLASGSTDGTFHLLCVATLTRRKGHAVLLDALAMLQDLPWTLTCAGSDTRDAETAQSLFRQADSLALQSRIHFTGEVDEDRLQQCYHEAELFVLASHHEGYGMVLDEAIARGLPIVASNAGAMAATVPVGAGLLCPPADPLSLATALRQFMEDSDTRDALQTAARQARDDLRSWQQAATEFDEALPW